MTHPFAHGRGEPDGSGELDELGPRPLPRLRERGASLVEYALLIALITVVCLAALNHFGDENEGLVNGSADKIVSASGS